MLSVGDFPPPTPLHLTQNGIKGHTMYLFFMLLYHLLIRNSFQACFVLVFSDLDTFKELRPVSQNIFQLVKILPECVIPSTLHWGHMISLCPINNDGDNFDHLVKVALARFPH